MTKTAEPLLEQLKGNLEKDSSLREELENKIKVCKTCHMFEKVATATQVNLSATLQACASVGGRRICGGWRDMDTRFA
jgi:uncharacterized protein (DUF169 family)